jgi:hypothetical protein
MSGPQYSAPRSYDAAFDMAGVNVSGDPSDCTGITASWILREAILTWFAA